MHPFHLVTPNADSESKPSIAPESLLFKSARIDSRVFIHVTVRQIKANDVAQFDTAGYQNEISLTGKRKM
jgi:hypothetical protein